MPDLVTGAFGRACRKRPMKTGHVNPVGPSRRPAPSGCSAPPCRAITTACQFSGMCSERPETATRASSASVGQLPSSRCAGTLACTTPARPLGQAYRGRTVTPLVTLLRNALPGNGSPDSARGMQSSRSVRSSPIRTILPPPQGQTMLSGSTMAQAVRDLHEQGSPAFDAAIPMLSQLLKAEMAEPEVRSVHCPAGDAQHR